MSKKYFIWFLMMGAALQGRDVIANPWQDLAKADINFIKKTIEKNHPGYVDPDNPQFKVQTEQSYRNVLGQLKYVQSLDAVLNLDNEFIASFADVHVAAEFRFSKNGQVWAGMKIDRRQNKYVVTRVASEWPTPLAPVGAQMISCDGRSVDEIMNYDVLRYRYANYQDNYPRLKFASKLLIDDGVGYRKRAASCVFKDVNGKDSTLALLWQYLGDHASYEWDSSYRKPEPFSVTQLGSSIIWVRVPSLKPLGNNPAQINAIAQSLSDMHLGADKVVVFDVRGNDGGSSVYGLKLVDSALDNVKDANAEYVLVPTNHGAKYRASVYNLDYFKTQISNSAVTDHSLLDKYHDELITTLEQAISNHQSLAEFKWTIVAKNQATNSPATDQRIPKLAILTDRHCASSCLDFVQYVLSVRGAVQLGEETFADSRYNEPNFFGRSELPSKLGEFWFPLKILNQRGPYQPSFQYEGDINDTEAVKQWVQSLKLN